MKNFNSRAVLERPFSDLPMIVMNMKNKQEIVKELEVLARRAGMLAAYINEREGYGCGDQGHEQALKIMNKTGKTIWKAFGYSAFNDLSF